MKTLLKSLLCLPILALAACNGVEYVDRQDYREIIKQKYSSDYGREINDLKSKELGGIIIKRNDLATVDSNPMIFGLKRDKKKITAETRIFESTNFTKTSIDQAFLDFGYDKDNKQALVSMSLKF